MSTKELAMETIKGLPDNASWQEIEARIHLLAEVNLGYEQLQRGEGTTITSENEFLNLARAKNQIDPLPVGDSRPPVHFRVYPPDLGSRV